MSFRFQNRIHAGRLLADNLGDYAGRPEVVVLGLPRGGVPVAHQVALRLRAPLDIFLVRKLGAPGQEELAMGAIASGGMVFLNDTVVEELGASRQTINAVIARELAELQRRETAYRAQPRLDLRGRQVILVDDGLATGASMRVAFMAVRRQHPAGIVAAAPVAERHTYDNFQREVGEIECVQIADDFRSVGQWYEDFSQTSEEEVRRLLAGEAGRQ